MIPPSSEGGQGGCERSESNQAALYIPPASGYLAPTQVSRGPSPKG